MTAINFPAAPATGATHTEAGITWTFDGATWDTSGAGYVAKAGDTMTGNLTVPKVFIGPAGNGVLDENANEFRFYEQGGTQRGAVLKLADCKAAVGSKILTNVSSKIVNEYKFVAGVAAADLPVGVVTSPGVTINQINFTGVNCVYASANAAFSYNGGSNPCPCFLRIDITNTTTNAVAATAYQAVIANAAQMRAQLSATVIVSVSSLDPTATYRATTHALKSAPEGPTAVADSGLAILGQSIVS